MWLTLSFLTIFPVESGNGQTPAYDAAFLAVSILLKLPVFIISSQVYIPVENHTKIQLKTIPLIDAYLHSFFTNEGRIKNDKYEYKTKDYSSPIS